MEASSDALPHDHWRRPSGLGDVCEGLPGGIEKIVRSAARSRTDGETLHLTYTLLLLGGLETDPVTRALVGEEIGRHDSAAAWTLENPLDWAFFCCRLPDEGAEEIYSRGADILIAAQFGRPLKAVSANGGYRISGRAPFVSNCYDADWISSTVLVDQDGSGGVEPEMRMVYFRSEECEIIDTWDVMGMRGTGSNDISVTDAYVPRSRTFPMVPDFEPGSHYRGPLYRRRPVSRRRCWGWRDALSTR